MSRATSASTARRYGLERVCRTWDRSRSAVAAFVERYNQCWRLETLAYRTPSEAREQFELRHAA